MSEPVSKRSTSAGRVVATVAAVGVLGLTTVTGVAATLERWNFHVHKGPRIVHVSQSPTPTPSATSTTHQTYSAVNILVMGTDTRTGQGKDYGTTRDSSGNGHSDTTLFIHIPADRSWAEVVSIPRDTTYHLPKCAKSQHVVDRFNAAFAGGGAICTIQLVEQITKRNVDHYVVVHLNDFKKVVNVLGGVPVCTTAKISDPLTGTGTSQEGTNLVLRKGWTNLNGTQALQLMRARAHLGDGSDLSRISRQQIVLSAIVRKIISKGTLANPAKALSVLNALSSAMTADPDLADPLKAADFGLTLQGVKPSNIQFVRMPTLPNSDRATVRMSSQAIAMWAALAQDHPWPALAKPHPKPTGIVTPPGKPLKTLPSHVQVQVLNGTGVAGAATNLGNALQSKGFAFIGAGNYTTSTVAHTFIEYDPKWNESARTLSASLGGVPMVRVAGLKGTLKVVLGQDKPTVVAVYVTTPKPKPTYVGPQGTGVTTANKTTCITP